MSLPSSLLILLVVAGCPRQTDDHARGAASAAPAPTQPWPPSDGELVPRDVAVPVTGSSDAAPSDGGVMDAARRDAGPL